MLHIIWSIIIGFIVGLCARAIMPGMQHLTFIMTTLLGIGGSIVGGLIGRLFSRPAPGSAFHPAGFIMSIIGALILLWAWGKLGAALMHLRRAILRPTVTSQRWYSPLKTRASQHLTSLTLPTARSRGPLSP